MARHDFPNIDHLLKERLRESLAKDWPGTDEDLDAEVDRLITEARRLGAELRASRKCGENQ